DHSCAGRGCFAGGVGNHPPRPSGKSACAYLLGHSQLHGALCPFLWADDNSVVTAHLGAAAPPRFLSISGALDRFCPLWPGMACRRGSGVGESAPSTLFGGDTLPLLDHPGAGLPLS